MPEARTLHIDQGLTDFSVKYSNADMIWRGAMPLVKVNHRSDKFYKYTKEDSFRLSDDKIGPKSLPNEIDWSVAQDNYSVKDHALGDWVPQEEIDNADNPLQPEIDTVDFLNLQMDIAQESRVAGIVFAAGSYPSANKVQLSGTGQWGQSADDPIGNILTALETPYQRPNTIIMGGDVWPVFRKLPEVLDAVKGSTRYQGSPGGLATVAECAGLFEVQNWLIGRARHITSKEGHLRPAMGQALRGSLRGAQSRDPLDRLRLHLRRDVPPGPERFRPEARHQGRAFFQGRLELG